MTGVTDLDTYMGPLGAPGWADQVAADSRADDARFTIDDDRAASWALRKRAKPAARIAAVKADVAERKALLDAYEADATGSDRSRVEFFDGLLADYGRRVLADDPDRKTIDLPEGRVKSRTTSPAVVVSDVDALARWAAANGADYPEPLVEPQPPRPAPLRTLRRYFTAAGVYVVDPDVGEPIPGLSVREGTTTFTVTTGGAS